MKKNFFACAIIILPLMLLTASCQKEQTAQIELKEFAISAKADKSNVFKGPTVAIGNGYARSWIRITHDGQPQEIGVELTEAGLASLPHHNQQMLLPLHPKAKNATPFDHIGFNYMHHGHFPPGVFDVPHFDVHFYMQTIEERMAIPVPGPTTMHLFMLAPPAGYMPPTYTPGGAEAQMGMHWAPPPPTFLPFSRVMIYGSYNGAFTFVEPMVTIAYLQGSTSSNPYLQPEKFAKAGNYPTVYNIYKDDATGSRHITLSNFVTRPAD